MIETILRNHGILNPVIEPTSIKDVEKDTYYAYILLADGEAIVVGHGRINRVRVIFNTGNAHIKAFLVRVYSLYGKKAFSRFIIPCSGKQEAEAIERILHKEIGGNKNVLPAELEAKLFAKFEKGSREELFVKMAQCSSFDGISDLRMWKRKGFIADSEWEKIREVLKI